MGLFERYLSVWVGLGMAAGVALGLWAPQLFQAMAAIEFAHVNLVVAVFIWVMIYPMMIQIDFASIKQVGQRPRGLMLTLVINWLVKPFTMAALAVLFFEHLFAGWVDPQSASEYIAGMILLGVAPCTAMVFVWSQLTRGDPNYTLVQVSVNDLIMVFAFAPHGRASAGRDRRHRALADAGAVHRSLRGAAAAGRRRHAACVAACGRHRTAGARCRGAEAVVGARADRHRGAAVRASGAHAGRAAADHRADRGAAGAAELRHLRHRVCRRAKH